MSTEKTSDLLRRAADAWVGNTAGDDVARRELRRRADRLEREQPPLPERPGFYELIVVERGGEKCTGAMLCGDGAWHTAHAVDGYYSHEPTLKGYVTIRWAEQDDPTPGQTVREAADAEGQKRLTDDPFVRDQIERITAAVLAAYATPTLTPVGEHPEPGTRGLMPVVLVMDEGAWVNLRGNFVCSWRPMQDDILADPRPDGAL